MDRRASQRRAIIRHQLAAGRLILLAVALLTLVNQLLLLFKVDYHFLLSSAVAHYVNWLWVQMDAHWGWAVLNVLLTLCIDVFYCGCWFLSGGRRRYLTMALFAYGLDTLLLMIFAFTMLSNPASCIIEILAHLGALYLLMMADQAAGAAQRMRYRTRA